MKVSKAIEILSESANAGMTTFNQDYKDAQKLGIEALKRVKQCRSAPYGRLEDILPGETPEEVVPLPSLTEL